MGAALRELSGGAEGAGALRAAEGRMSELSAEALVKPGGVRALAEAMRPRQWTKNVYVLAVSFGFVLRAAAGAAVIPAEISPWLLLCTFLLALFISLGKRRHELVLLGGAADAHRSALQRYTVPLLESWLTALAGATI